MKKVYNTFYRLGCSKLGAGPVRNNPSVRGGSFFCSDKGTEDMKIYVGNMPFSMDENKIKTLFSEFGEVESANVITDRETGRPRGFAFVEMKDDDARKAIKGLNEREVDGRKLNVNEARPRDNKGGGGGRGGRW